MVRALNTAVAFSLPVLSGSSPPFTLPLGLTLGLTLGLMLSVYQPLSRFVATLVSVTSWIRQKSLRLCLSSSFCDNPLCFYLPPSPLLRTPTMLRYV